MARNIVRNLGNRSSNSGSDRVLSVFYYGETKSVFLSSLLSSGYYGSFHGRVMKLVIEVHLLPRVKENGSVPQLNNASS